MTATDHAGLLDAVAADPDDRLSRLALADWHEERGEALEADCWRWLAASGKKPLYNPDGGTSKSPPGELPYWWYYRWAADPSRQTASCWLTEDWCFAVVDDENDGGRFVKCFRAASSAYLAAVAAWCQLADAQRREAWGAIEGKGEGEGDGS